MADLCNLISLIGVKIYMNNLPKTSSTQSYWSWFLKVISSPTFLWQWVWSWFDTTPTAAKPKPTVVILSDKIMHELLQNPNDVLGYVLSFLHPQELHALVSTQKVGLFKSIANDVGVINQMSHALCRLVAMEGENNQNKAALLLKSSPGLASRIIGTKILMQDAAGRRFKTPMSAYGYVFLVKDSPMCFMLQGFMCDETR